MSGRAGRRGIDTRGVVLIQVDEQINSEILKGVVKVGLNSFCLDLFISDPHLLLNQGKADPLKSAFRLTYNMILNLLRVDGISPEYILERSFLQYQSYADIPKVLDRKWLCLLDLSFLLPICFCHI